MPQDSSRRMPVNGPQSPLASLSGVLSGLDALNLPPGPDKVAVPAGPDWKPGRVVLRREKAHRGGKTVIVIHDFATHLPLSFIETIAKKLRASCGCGGTVRGREIEIQGDQAAKIRGVLEKEGFQVAGVR